MPGSRLPVLVLGLSSLITMASMLVLVCDRNSPLWPRATTLWSLIAARASSPLDSPPLEFSRVPRRLPQLRGVVARQGRIEQNFVAGSSDANNGLQLLRETLTRFDADGTPIEYVARIRRTDGAEVQTHYYSAREVAFRDVANRRLSPLASCVVRAEPNPGLLSFPLPTLTTPEALRAVGYRPQRTPELRAPVLEPLGARRTALLTNARVSTWIRHLPPAVGRGTDTVVVNSDDGRIVAATFTLRGAGGVLERDSRQWHGPIELYDSSAFPTLRPAILDTPCG